VAGVVSSSYGYTVTAEEEITIMAGGTEALFSSISAFVHPGDEVILFDPSYDSYDPAIRLCGGKPLRLALEPPSFNIDWDQVERSITPRTRMIMINTPHNPTGRILHDDDLRSLERLVLKHGLL